MIKKPIQGKDGKSEACSKMEKLFFQYTYKTIKEVYDKNEDIRLYMEENGI